MVADGHGGSAGGSGGAESHPRPRYFGSGWEFPEPEAGPLSGWALGALKEAVYEAANSSRGTPLVAASASRRKAAASSGRVTFM